MIFGFCSTQCAGYPRAASDAVAKPFIADLFENIISPLLRTTMPGFSHAGRYSYASFMRPSISSAVSALFARSIMRFS